MPDDFNDLVARHLDSRLPQHMATSIDFLKLPSDTQAFIRRSLVLMKHAGYGVTQFNPALMRWLSTIIPSMLPSAWGGRIPPITLPGQHQKLDAYVAAEFHPPFAKPPVYVDVGCGFPPVTAADTAQALPDWHIYGVDRSFADFVLYDKDGHYACFDQAGNFEYFQALLDTTRTLYADPTGTRQHFEKMYADLLPLLPESDGSASECVEKDGNRLIGHPIRDFEIANLALIKKDFMQLELPSATVIRCMNVLIYFDSPSREKILSKAGDLLKDDGIVIVGTNGYGIQTRYAVYRKKGGGLFASEFAFGLDNLGHIVFMPWFSIHANDPEAMLLALLAGTIRCDRNFWPSFSGRLDELLAAHDICSRSPDGFLHQLTEDISPVEYIQKNGEIWQQMEAEGYTDRTVEVLEQAGYTAWKNRVGDIAIEPPPGTLPSG